MYCIRKQNLSTQNKDTAFMDRSGPVLLIGGSGFVGESLIVRLLDLNYEVSCFDLVQPSELVSALCTHVVIGEITDELQILKAVQLAKPKIIVHLASYGMSGSAMLDDKCYDVNVGGTRNIIKACVAETVELLVYTSSYNVIFGGQEIYNGQESVMSYYPPSMAVDCYGPTKALAEEIVIKANGTLTSLGKTLKTCSIRPAAIYGEHEKRHFTRIIKHIDSGLFLFRIGNALVDWVYIDNLLDAYELVISLHDGNVSCKRSSSVAPYGRCYAISDGTPIDNFEFLKPLCEARLCEFPTLTIPTPAVICFAYLCEKMYFFFKLLGIQVEPFLTRSEVYKVGVTHYFSIAKAQRELGYRPIISSGEGSLRMAKHYGSNVGNKHFFRFAHLFWWLACVGGMFLTWHVGYASKISPVFQLFHDIAIVIFKSRENVKMVFVIASLLHISEAVYAYDLAASKGCDSSRRFMWFFQTLFLGYPSLRLIHSRPSDDSTIKSYSS